MWFLVSNPTNYSAKDRKTGAEYQFQLVIRNKEVMASFVSRQEPLSRRKVSRSCRCGNFHGTSMPVVKLCLSRRLILLFFVACWLLVSDFLFLVFINLSEIIAHQL